MSTTTNTSNQHQSREALLRSQAVTFCNAFLQGQSPQQILNGFFVTHNHHRSPQITEHGPPWATSRLPFLGRTFTGRQTSSAGLKDPGKDSKSEAPQYTCDDYFQLLAQTLEFRADKSAFPPPHEFVVDVNAGGGEGVVTVVGKAEFVSVKTGRDWAETFTHRLSGFDEQGRIGHWEIWADPLSAWVAVGGEDGDKK